MSLKFDCLPELETVFALMPLPIYWADTKGRLIGGNTLFFNTFKASPTLSLPYHAQSMVDLYGQILGHTLGMLPNNAIDSLKQALVLNQEGTTRYFTLIKTTLLNELDEIVGIIGICHETTEQKEIARLQHEYSQQEMRHQKLELQRQAEQLRFESELREVIHEEKKRFKKVVDKMVHDLTSPLAALKMMIDICDELSENKRVLMKRAVESILDMTHHLMMQKDMNPHLETKVLDIEHREPLLFSDLLHQLLSEKKMQYRNHPYQFEIDVDHSAYFVFIYAQKNEVRRAVSNLMSNAASSFSEQAHGEIKLALQTDETSVTLTLSDNSHGKSAKKIHNMLECYQRHVKEHENTISLGLQQVWDMLKNNQGIIEVLPEQAHTTAITLTFPRISAANWIAQEIKLQPDQLIIILDDEETIHHAWHARFQGLFNDYPALQLQCFTQGDEALAYINTLSFQDKQRSLFLSDYELLHQKQNGLDIIQISHIPYTILVTSYYAAQEVQEAIVRLKIQILPKQMAAIVPIFMT